MVKIDLHINKVLTLSTAHIKLASAVSILDLMEKGKETGWNELVIYHKANSGWIINTNDVDVEEMDIPEGLGVMLPQDLRDLLRLAKEHDCDWLCLNRYIEPMEGLPIFNWAEEYHNKQDATRARKTFTMYYHDFDYSTNE